MELALLVKLQDVDSKIMELELSLGDLPDQVKSLNEQLAQHEHDIAGIENESKELSSQKRRLEAEIDLLNEKLKKYQEQVYSVTTNKEYDAISNEIENTQVAIENSETLLLELLEKEDEFEDQLENKKTAFEQVKKELYDKNNLLNEKLKNNEEKINELHGLRKEYVKQIKRPLYANYERIRKGRNGFALAEINKYICQGCFATIPAQTVVEVRKMNSIILCETCGRILIHRNSN